MGVAEGGNYVHGQGFEGGIEVDGFGGIVFAKAGDEDVDLREGYGELG